MTNTENQDINTSDIAQPKATGIVVRLVDIYIIPLLFPGSLFLVSLIRFIRGLVLINLPKNLSFDAGLKTQNVLDAITVAVGFLAITVFPILAIIGIVRLIKKIRLAPSKNRAWQIWGAIGLGLFFILLTFALEFLHPLFNTTYLDDYTPQCDVGDVNNPIAKPICH